MPPPTTTVRSKLLKFYPETNPKTQDLEEGGERQVQWRHYMVRGRQPKCLRERRPKRIIARWSLQMVKAHKEFGLIYLHKHYHWVNERCSESHTGIIQKMRAGDCLPQVSCIFLCTEKSADKYKKVETHYPLPSNRSVASTSVLVTSETKAVG